MTPFERQALATKIKDLIDAHCVEKYGGYRSHRLSVSELGDECARRLWYKFRWAAHKPVGGRLARFFERGNLEEARWIGWLKGIGFEVWDIDPNAKPEAKNKQFRVKACSDHVGGFLDGVGRTDLVGTPLVLLLEFKAIATAAFTKLANEGVAKNRPKYFSQMSSYGKHHGLKYGLFCASCRNDDNLHIEVVELNFNLADDLMRKAEDIVRSQAPPTRLAESPTYYECKTCDFAEVCHNKGAMDKSCRTCTNSSPVEGGKWWCSLWKLDIPYEIEEAGCDSFKAMMT